MAGRLAVPNPQRSIRGRDDREVADAGADQACGRRVVIPQRVAVADQPANAVTGQPRAVGLSIEGQDPHRSVSGGQEASARSVSLSLPLAWAGSLSLAEEG